MAVVSYEQVMARVESAANAAGRAADDVTVVAVSKTFPPEAIMTVYEMGHRDFGENRAQELASKAAQLPGDIRWHFVGALQSNKARLIRHTTHLLHSMDRRSLGSAWMKGPGRPPPVLAEVNLGGETQKSGVALEGLDAALDWMVALGLDVRGLMAIPPAPEDPEDSRPYFRRLRRALDELAAKHPNLVELSMGMTDDFEVAISEGASIIRVGRAIFGPRNSTGA